MNDIQENLRYFFIFAHPDDEVYSCILMSKLIKQKKEVHAIYITSGDSAGLGAVRENEVKKSMQLIGVKNENLHFLTIPEREILNNLRGIVKSLLQLANKYCPDCIIGQDYEGGHEAHDAISFCTYETVRLLEFPKYFVFPIYYGRPNERKGARFKPQVKTFLTLPFSKQESKLKENVLHCHQSQKSHFDGLKKSANDYLYLLLSREVYRQIKGLINYQNKPMPEIGYEYHRNGFKFSDFLKAINKYKSASS